MSQNFPHAARRPIGIFDSGIGGLTVAHAVTKLLPQESIIYFGDTMHAPWGDKSAVIVQRYASKICEMLLQKGCKLILIACNTASAAANERVKDQIAQQVLVVDVINPMVDYLGKHFNGKKVGLIGSKQTIYSNIYQKKLKNSGIQVELGALATPLLVPLIEEGFAGRSLTLDILKEYLVHPNLQGIQALVLGCTHYPLIKQHLHEFYQDSTIVLDSAEIVANALKDLLTQHNLLNQSQSSEKRFFVSDYTDAFSTAAKLFFSETVELEKYPLWEHSSGET